MNIEIILAAAISGVISSLVAALFFYCRPKFKKKSKKSKTAMEFSKRIFLGLSVLVCAVTIFVCVMVWHTEDVSVTHALIDHSFGLLKFGVVSYFGKAALENRIKLTHLFPKFKHKIFADRNDH